MISTAILDFHTLVPSQRKTPRRNFSCGAFFFEIGNGGNQGGFKVIEIRVREKELHLH